MSTLLFLFIYISSITSEHWLTDFLLVLFCLCVVIFVWEVFILFDTVGLLHYQRVSLSHLHILAKVSDFYWYSAKFIIGTISKQNSNSVDLLSDLWGKVCRAYNSYTVIIKIAVCPEPFFLWLEKYFFFLHHINVSFKCKLINDI